MSICGTPWSKLSPQGPGSLALLVLAALLRPVSPHALALFLALSIGGVLGGGALRRSFNPTDVLPSHLAGVVGSLSLLPPLQARPLALALVVLSSRSFDRWYLTRWHSFAALSTGSSTGGTSRINAPSDAVDKADDIPALWQVITGFPTNLGHLHIQASLP